MPPISARVQIEKHFDGPCPEGELVGMYYEDPIDNPLDMTNDILHLIVRCPNDIAGDGIGGGYGPSSGTGSAGTGLTTSGRGARQDPSDPFEGKPWTDQHAEIYELIDWAKCVETGPGGKFAGDCCLDVNEMIRVVQIIYGILYETEGVKGSSMLQRCLKGSLGKFKFDCRDYDSDTPYQVHDAYDRSKISSKLVEWVSKSQETKVIELYPHQREDTPESRQMLLSVLLSNCKARRDAGAWDQIISALFISGANPITFFDCDWLLQRLLDFYQVAINNGWPPNKSLKEYYQTLCNARPGSQAYHDLDIQFSNINWNLCSGQLLLMPAWGQFEPFRRFKSLSELCELNWNVIDSGDTGDRRGLQFVRANRGLV